MNLFLRGDYSGVYELFLLPGLRIAAIVLAVILYGAFDSETFWTRYLYLFLLITLPAVAGVVYYLLAINVGVAAICLTGLLLGFAWFLVFVSASDSGHRRAAVR